MSDSKPSSPIGDLIPDSAWHPEWRADHWLELAQNYTNHCVMREKNHQEVYAALLSSASRFTSQAIDKGHEKTQSLLLHDRKITDFYGNIATTFSTMAANLTTFRAQMDDIATYATSQIQQYEAIGDIDAAQEIRQATISEITTLGEDMATTITKLAEAIDVPQWREYQ